MFFLMALKFWGVQRVYFPIPKNFQNLRREHKNAFSYIKTRFDDEDGFLPAGRLTLINAW